MKNSQILKRILIFILAFALITGLGTFMRNKYPSMTTMHQYQNQRLAWSSCYDNFQCATLQVPIDYKKPESGSFGLALLRYKATDQKNRLGSLVVNPGGPGASGKQYAYNAEYILSPAVLAQYDIVGFDPRGVGDSAPIECLSNNETDANYSADSKPDSAIEVAAMAASAKKYAAKCLAKNKNVANYSTANSARDMDILRNALGDSHLNFLGKSYGTYLGTLYAKFFPANVGRMVLDGAIDPKTSAVEQTMFQGMGFDRALHAFIRNCYKKNNCPLKKPIANSINQIIDLFHQAAIHPLLGPKNRQATESLLVLGTASALYDDYSGWPKLRIALQQAAKNNGTTFLELADEYSGRNANGTYANNETDAAFVIDCLDWPEVRTLDEMAVDAKAFAVAAPVFGPYVAYGSLACKYLPPPADGAAATKITTIKTTPIMVIGTKRDPATPYQWAQSLHETIQGSRLISLNADGHTGHGRGSECVDSAVDKYFLTGVLPGKDLACSL